MLWPGPSRLTARCAPLRRSSRAAWCRRVKRAGRWRRQRQWQRDRASGIARREQPTSVGQWWSLGWRRPRFGAPAAVRGRTSTSPRAASAPAMSVGPRPPRAEMLVRMSRCGIEPATRSAIAMVPSDPPASTTRISTRSGEPIVLSRLLSTDSIFRASLYAGMITDTRPPFAYGLSGDTPGTWWWRRRRRRRRRRVARQHRRDTRRRRQGVTAPRRTHLWIRSIPPSQQQVRAAHVDKHERLHHAGGEELSGVAPCQPPLHVQRFSHGVTTGSSN